MPTPGRALSEVRDSLAAYDVLGYLLPGGVLLLGIGLFEFWAKQVSNQTHTPILTAASTAFGGMPEKNSWAMELFVFAIAMAATYVLGHVVASFSAILLDRVYVKRAHGSPFAQYLELNRPTQSQKRAANFYRTLFLAANLYLFLKYMALPNGVLLSDILPTPFKEQVQSFLFIPSRFQTAASVTFWLTMTMVAAKLLVSTSDSRTQWVVELWEHPAMRLIGAAIDWGLSVPAGIARGFTGFLGAYLKSKDSLDEPTRIAFSARLAKRLGFNPQLGAESTFWYTVLRVREASPAIAEPAENWLRLYSFARNMGCALFFVFLYCYLFWLNQSEVFPEVVSPAKKGLFVMPLLIWGIGFIMLLRYYYLYVDYYSKYLIQAFVYLDCPPSGETGSPTDS